MQNLFEKRQDFMLKILKTKDSVENKEDIKKNLEKLAANNIISNRGNLLTYPIKRVKENTKYIFLVYTLLNEHIKIGIPIHPAGEWLLDNYYIIEKASKNVQKDLTRKKYKNLPSLLDNSYDKKYMSRIYYMANEIVSNTDGKIEKDDLIDFINAYQTQKDLTMEEIWNIGLFLQICLIEKIREIAEKIFISQTQKFKAQNIISRFVDERENRFTSFGDKRTSYKNGNIRLIGTNTSYPFIEYMSFKLKKIGEKAQNFQRIFETEVEKTGNSVSDIIKREHFDIALKTLSMKNAITSIKKISRMNVIEIFESTNAVEKILNNDPANVYPKMDFETKAYYRSEIVKISKKTRISEIFIAKQIINLCNENSKKNKKEDTNSSYYGKIKNCTLENKAINLKKCADKNKIENAVIDKIEHVGYYLIDDGKEMLLKRLLGRKTFYLSKEKKAKIYIFAVYLLANISIILLFPKFKILALVLSVPIQNVITKLIQYILSKNVRPKLIPKMQIESDLPDEAKTICVCPTILKNEDNVKEMFDKLEVYYLANKSKNLYFALLGDCTSEKIETTKEDNKIAEAGKKISSKLNEKYGEVFFFFYRKREWNSKEECFMGWERKRGMLSNLNDFLVTGKSVFMVNTALTNKNTDFFKNNKVKYVITIDEDTNLILGSVKKLVGAMEHILNKPELDVIQNKVISGHGIIQPRIAIDIESANKTKFSRIFTNNMSGLDIYTNAISDTYQDNFDEGIYTGKGIYDLKTFYKLLNNQIKENTVLSHDLLEGNILRCGLATDIVLLDSYPSNYNSYKIRKHRWIRGDVQLIPYLKEHMNLLSKYKIVDNLNRNLNEACITICFIFAVIAKKYLLLPLTILGIIPIINIINSLLEAESTDSINKTVKSSLREYFMSVITLIDMAYLEINAYAKALYRTFISNKHMLEWTTSGEAEQKNRKTLSKHTKGAIVQTIISIIILLYGLANINQYSKLNLVVLLTLCVLWLEMPFIMFKIGQDDKEKIKIKNKDRDYLIKIAMLTWQFFKDNLINALPIDNYQEDRKEKQALRTSPTNIGLYLMAIITSYDLGFETLQSILERIEKTISTIENLPKWNGHLYNWYNLEKLMPIYPYDISSVDSGNFIGYMITTKEFLKTLNQNAVKEKLDVRSGSESFNKRVEELIEKIEKIINETDFSKLYNKENGLLSIGYNVEQNKLYDSYYDLLASEARQASLIAIAKKDIEEKHFQNLGRTLTKIENKKCLVSWGGTAFEYLMPNINIKTYTGTILDESQKMAVKSQIMYGAKLSIPWGISEAAFSLKDFHGNYQYKTFGIPWLGLKRNLGEDVVVSPYSTALALTIDHEKAIENLKRLEKEGAIGKYGFYDSIDYKPKKEVIKTFMAHHQGMILASIDNVLNDNIFQKRFSNDKKIQGVMILLQEKMPNDAVIKEKKDKARKLKYEGYEEQITRTKGLNVISTNKLTNLTKENKEGFTKLGNIIINNGVNLFIKNTKTNEIIDFNEVSNENSKIEFLPYKTKLTEEDGKIKIEQEITIAPLSQVEVRKITLRNKSLEKENLEITTYEEPRLSSKEQFEAHPAFDKMFLKFEEIENALKVTRRKRTEDERIVIEYVGMLSEDNKKMEYEIDKENFKSRNKNEIPEAIKNSKQLSSKIYETINPIIALRRSIELNVGEKKEIYLVRSVGENEEKVKENFKEYSIKENLERVFELSKAQTRAETRYMNLTEKEVAKYQKELEKIYNKKSNTNEERLNKEKMYDLSNENLWKFGISGDYPIILVKLKDYNDYYLIDEAFKMFEYYKSKNISTEMCIMTDIGLNKEQMSIDMQRYMGVREGIFIVEKASKDDKKVLELKATIIMSTLTLIEHHSNFA